MKDMKTSTFKHVAWGVVGGIALCAIGGFWGLGWMTAGTADQMAREAATAAYVDALTPQCVARAEAEPDKIAALKKERSYSQRGFVEKAGWSSYPDGASYNLKSTLSEACAKALTAG